MLKEYSIRTRKRNELIDITHYVEEAIVNSGVSEGIAVIYVPHTTAGVTINENADPSVKNDISNYLSELIPHSWRYSHLEGNSDSHIKSSIISPSISLIISNGRPLLGTWQGIFFCEFDGPRTRKFFIKIIKG